jgi:hypothetical protein
VVGSSNGSAGALVATDRPVLVESSSAGDGRLVDLGVGVDIVDGSITGNSSLVGHAVSGVVVAVVFQDIVLDEGAGGPAVNSEVSITGGAEGARKVDVAIFSNLSVIGLKDRCVG